MMVDGRCLPIGFSSSLMQTWLVHFAPLPLLSLFVDVQRWIVDQRVVHKWRRCDVHFRQDNWCVVVHTVCPYWNISYPKWHHLVYEQSQSASTCSGFLSIVRVESWNHQIRWCKCEGGVVICQAMANVVYHNVVIHIKCMIYHSNIYIGKLSW